ncbi:MAG TPA: penicillin acylase family protein [Verrucomicrobiae bacterium]|nr:penicillin acylase family protein [Verrucomicrobiae bacterium]
MKLGPCTLGVLFASASVCWAGSNATSELERWEKEARNVTITRDDWGIAHVTGKTDADAVFGMIYAQAEDDFNRVENNYLLSLGLLAQAEGESRIYLDLRQRLFIDPVELKNLYAASPGWLRALMNAWADGLNFYLAKHPEVKPRVIRRFEPWMALSFTEGSIGGDIERVNLRGLEDFYGKPAVTASISSPAAEKLEDASGILPRRDDHGEPTGSNGIAIAPANTSSHHALLLINPHTSFFFRSELQVTSAEGLNAYGAATWGQFFIYQGFNERTGWMHTSSGVDVIDEYLETVTKKGDRFVYKHGDRERPVISREIIVPYQTTHGMAEKKFVVFRTHHGPVIRRSGEKWVAVSLMQEPIKALEQSYLRTKARDYKSYRKIMELKANSSNNTIFADADGDIAYFHGNYIPRRDTKFDWTRPVDGSNPETDPNGLLTVEQTPHLLNPPRGWLYNANDAPWSAAGTGTLRKKDFPVYVETGGESARGRHAIQVLQDRKDFTLDSLVTTAYDSYLPWFERPVSALVKSWDLLPAADPLKQKLAGQVLLLRQWDLRWDVKSVATSVAIFWGEEIRRYMRGEGAATGEAVADVSAQQLLQSLATASEKLAADFGTWRTPWGDINRFQRLTGDIVQPFNDSQPSAPVGFPSGNWGSLASFGANPHPGTKKWYGTSGNSFVAVVEFGKQVRARAVTAGGESGSPSSRHFNDETGRYSTGDLREVYFYPGQLQGHTEREYHPGN